MTIPIPVRATADDTSPFYIARLPPGHMWTCNGLRINGPLAAYDQSAGWATWYNDATRKRETSIGRIRVFIPEQERG